MPPKRIAAAAGGLFVLAQLGSTAAAGGPPPNGDDPLAQLVGHYHDHFQALLLSDYLFGISVAFLLVFVAGLRVAVWREGDGGVLPGAVLAGGLVGGAMMLVDGAAESTVGFAATHGGGDALVLALFELSKIVFGFMAVPLCVLVGATSLAVLSGAFAPRWMGLAGIAVALVLLVAPIYIFSGAAALTSLAGLAYVLFLAWAAAASFFLYRAPAA